MPYSKNCAMSHGVPDNCVMQCQVLGTLIWTCSKRLQCLTTSHIASNNVANHVVLPLQAIALMVTASANQK